MKQENIFKKHIYHQVYKVVCYTKNFKKIWSGKKDVFEIELENGKKIRATEEHLFFTSNGLKKLKDLTEKDELIEIN